MKLLAGFLAVALAQDSDRWGFYDYYGNSHGKSQTSQTGIMGNQIGQEKASVIGNGRICWHCNERNYGHCLDANGPTLGDSHRHGAAYCVGEEYFCYIHERRIIRHDGNDWDFEMRQPWSQGSADTYQEENVAFAGSNMSPDTNIRVEMGCQQPSACLRQMHQNYKIEMGMPYHVQSSDVALPTLPVVHGGLAREGMCRLGQDWRDYASGNHDSDNWRMGNWRETPFMGVWDRRYGAVRNHYHYGKGTESVCHHCCDPLLEFGNTDGDAVTTPYDYMGCNFNAIMTSADISSGGTVDGMGNVDDNAFLQRSHVWDTPVWYNNMQYHGMFRNPHTQYPRNTVSYNVGGAHPNARR
jgi:hypothetical protein